MGDEFAISGLKSASGHIAVSGEIIKGNGFPLLIPNQQSFAAIYAVIDRMKEPDRLAVKRAFPLLHIDGRLTGP